MSITEIIHKPLSLEELKQQLHDYDAQLIDAGPSFREQLLEAIAIKENHYAADVV